MDARAPVGGTAGQSAGRGGSGRHDARGSDARLGGLRHQVDGLIDRFPSF